jgi:hypothetical protein
MRRGSSASQRSGQLAKSNQQKNVEKVEDKPESTGAVRLDLNLEAEVLIKAKIHGDLTLAIEM